MEDPRPVDEAAGFDNALFFDLLEDRPDRRTVSLSRRWPAVRRWHLPSRGLTDLGFEFIRTRLREEGFLRRVLSPTTLYEPPTEAERIQALFAAGNAGLISAATMAQGMGIIHDTTS